MFRLPAPRDEYTNRDNSYLQYIQLWYIEVYQVGASQNEDFVIVQREIKYFCFYF